MLIWIKSQAMMAVAVVPCLQPRCGSCLRLCCALGSCPRRAPQPQSHLGLRWVCSSHSRCCWPQLVVAGSRRGWQPCTVHTSLLCTVNLPASCTTSASSSYAAVGLQYLCGWRLCSASALHTVVAAWVCSGVGLL